MELRIAPELFLKELIVGGFERVFEIGKVFRNEGISPTHNPEFTMCEFYVAYQNYEFMMSFIETLFRELIREVTGANKMLISDGTEINFDKPFNRIDVIKELETHFNRTIQCDTNLEYTLNSLYEDHIRTTHEFEEQILNIKQKTDTLIKDLIEVKCTQPTFVIHHPVFVSPLAKSCKDRPLLTERFELFINKCELANGYSELDDYKIQEARFKEQQRIKGLGNDPEILEEDKHFIEVLKYGMPPTTGCGIGIDRLCMLLAGVSNIREIIAFSHFRTSISDQF